MREAARDPRGVATRQGMRGACRGMRGASRSWKKQGMDSLLEPPGEKKALPTPRVQPCKTHFEFLTSKLQEN